MLLLLSLRLAIVLRHWLRTAPAPGEERAPL